MNSSFVLVVHDPQGEIVLVRPDRIDAIGPIPAQVKQAMMQQGAATRIRGAALWLNNGQIMLVSETREQVVNLLKAGGAIGTPVRDPLVDIKGPSGPSSPIDRIVKGDADDDDTGPAGSGSVVN